MSHRWRDYPLRGQAINLFELLDSLADDVKLQYCDRGVERGLLITTDRPLLPDEISALREYKGLLCRLVRTIDPAYAPPMVDDGPDRNVIP